VQLLEMLSENYGGRVELAKAYYKALTASVRKHFNGNGVIASMEHCNDFMFLGTEAISLGRVGMSLQLPMDRFVAQKSVKLQ
jgi:raffinose synthase